ncbi:hypothetical protein FRC11_010070 [Ceratobasidium sp. 423]|nr:hypothetical protein FRC11_010070 [Ceratobasidium sp. 423]
MLDQLNAAIITLEAAVDSYSEICQDIYAHYVDGQPVDTLPHDIASSSAKQLPIIKSFRHKLELAHIIAGRSRNASSPLVPIHSLPLEVLTRIFSLALGDNCIHHPAEFSPHYTHCPRLMSVCKYWYQVVMHSPVLWTHIDLTIRNGCDTTTPRMNLAKLYAERAGQMTLEIHMIDLEGDALPKYSASLVPFFTSIAPRVSSFSLDSRYPIICRAALVALFENCTPGTLATLDMRVPRATMAYGPIVLDEDAGWKPQGYEYDMRAITTDMSEERFEQIFRGVTVLRLGIIYPTRRWTSSVYHGLVELRIQWGVYIQVTESQFVELLRQSPRLRILEYAIKADLISPLGKDALIDPIYLNDLEVINFGDRRRSVENIVRWLAPGSKPLQVFLRNFKLGPCFLAFVSRSNITRLYCKFALKQDLINIVHHLPRLQSLALGDFQRARSPNSEGPEYNMDKKLPSSLETLYLIGLYRHISEPLHDYLQPLHKVLSLESLRRVVFYRCFSDRSEEFRSTLPALDLPGAELIIAPEDGPNPVGDWELFLPRLYD